MNPGGHYLLTIGTKDWFNKKIHLTFVVETSDLFLKKIHKTFIVETLDWFLKIIHELSLLKLKIDQINFNFGNFRLIS
jgi:hypothetical protein